MTKACRRCFERNLFEPKINQLNKSITIVTCLLEPKSVVDFNQEIMLKNVAPKTEIKCSASEKQTKTIYYMLTSTRTDHQYLNCVK